VSRDVFVVFGQWDMGTMQHMISGDGLPWNDPLVQTQPILCHIIVNHYWKFISRFWKSGFDTAVKMCARRFSSGIPWNWCFDASNKRSPDLNPIELLRHILVENYKSTNLGPVSIHATLWHARRRMPRTAPCMPTSPSATNIAAMLQC